MTRESAKQAWLHAYGRISWSSTRGLLGDATCAWADLDGFHVRQPPDVAPFATHLWGWTKGRLFRFRIDEGEAVGAELRWTAAAGFELVKVVDQVAVSWPHNEGRVSVDDQWRGLPVHVTTVFGLSPLSFARLDHVGDHRLKQP